MGSTRRAGSVRRGTGLVIALAIVTSVLVAGTVDAGSIATTGTTPSILEAVRTFAPTRAGVNEVQIDKILPAFGRQTFGSVGRYEQVRGTILGAVDPTDLRNAPITDLAHAPRNQAGLVEYSVQFVLLRPVDPSRGNHRVVYEPTNRGHIVSLFFLNSAYPTNDPTLGIYAGNGFLMREGYSIMSIAWDPTVGTTDGELQASYPVAKNRDGSPIVGPALEEITYDDTTAAGATMHPLTYPASTLDKSQATLTVREHYEDQPQVISSSLWAYNDDGTGVHLLNSATFEQSKLYEFTYLAKDPIVVGLGFAAIRDVADFMRNATTDHGGTRNPLAGQAQQIYTFCYSQPCRAMHDFVRLGFNQTASGKRAVDGIESIVGGASGGFFNYRFAQPGRSMRQHIGRWYPERQFPFANQVTKDAVTGETGGVHARCAITNTCPKVFEVNSETEYWNKAASLLTTDTQGTDLDLAATPNVRYYLLSGLSHAPETGTGTCQQNQNPLLPDPVARALLVALDSWVANGTTPPPNRVPRRRTGTLVPALPQSSVGFPAIPNVNYNGKTTTGDLFNFGTGFKQGVLATLPPVITKAAYPVFVPKTDADGNDVAGIRLPEIAVPVATYTGWNIRGEAYADDDLCNVSGMKLPFPATKALRQQTKDPRLSVAERYPTRANYVAKVTIASVALAFERLLLPEDVRRYVLEAAVRGPGG